MTAPRTANDPLATGYSAGFRSELRTYARSALPEAMVPAHFVVLPDLPKLPNGKVDRNNLPELSTDGASADLVAPRTTTETELARVWQDLLGLERIGVETSFFDLGGDSLTVLQMAARVKEAHGVRVDLRRFLTRPTVARLAELIGDRDDGVRVDSEGGNPRAVDAQVMVTDSVLPDDVGPEPGADPPAGPPYRTVLLTGGTGYTGAYLLRELLDRSAAAGTEVVVLARASDDADAAERVRDTLTGYGLWRPEYEGRITGVAADTSRPYLGLSRSTYAELAGRVELVVHNAALSSWTLPYAKAKPVNVFGSLEVLRFAGRRRVKPVHFVSSTAVFPDRPGEHRWAELERPEPDAVVGGYRQTKWVADRYMTQARARGIPTSVYRPGAITGASDSGVCSTDTFINDLIKGCVQLGAALDYDLVLEFVPVDYVAAAVAHVALGTPRDEAVYTIPSSRPVPMNEVNDLLVDFGYPLERLSYADWYARLIAAAERGEDNELLPYLPLFGPDGPAEEIGVAGARPRFDAPNLAAALAGSGIECPPVDRPLWTTYLEWFVSIGFLPPPPGASTTHRSSQ